MHEEWLLPVIYDDGQYVQISYLLDRIQNLTKNHGKE